MLNSDFLKSVAQSTHFEREFKSELSIYFIREWITNKGYSNLIIDNLKKYGYEILLTKDLNDEVQDTATREIRGGNWNEGVIYETGGKPVTMLVLLDLNVTPVPEERKKQYPFVKNGNFFKKELIRRDINALLSKENMTNPVHSSDDELEAMEYIKLLIPEEVEKIINKKVRLIERYHSDEHRVIKQFNGYNLRAKTELIEYEGEFAVKKTFRESQKKFMLNEIYASEVLSKKCNLIPPLLAKGENYIIFPYYKNEIDNEQSKRSILSQKIKEIANFLKFLYDEGFAHLDFHPGNIIYTKENGLKVIDFEYLFSYSKKPGCLLQSYDVIGPPKEFKGDKPVYTKYASESSLYDYYNILWEQTVGKKLTEIVKHEV
ncbi:hypothetical protein H1D32_22115 [Anaerobacillus sp. CMMVII]|uniref:AarF/UbiB family protein n=1 Tax=Anaerobacillus sp. CMMVII TaxID=2755588 RepID=UPI0021B7973C|nr:AarF/UbiB family protein [Anaerobacillus sp. CMMVII]MCT8140153.1 hypothetical protein [Anaerobacillus sp. CMMVII]